MVFEFEKLCKISENTLRQSNEVLTEILLENFDIIKIFHLLHSAEVRF